jgi:hypothetical protein
MDDKDLLSAVRLDFADVRMATPADTILADGDARRQRRLRQRRLGYGAGVAAVAAVAAIGGVALTSGSPAASGTHNAQLAAWTVQKEANGTIDVTIHDLTDPSALEQQLAADGAPSEVISEASYPASCVDYPAMTADMSSVITNGPAVPRGLAFVIHPAGIPSGTKLLIDVTPMQHTANGTSGGVGDKLWGFGASGKNPYMYVPVSAGLGLVNDASGC